MEIQDWKDEIVENAIRQITYGSNMSSKDVSRLTAILFDYLEDGMQVLRIWRKIKIDSEFLSKKYDTALVKYLIDRNSVSGRDVFDSYSSGGVNTKFTKSPESKLKSSFPQVM